MAAYRKRGEKEFVFPSPFTAVHIVLVHGLHNLCVGSHLGLDSGCFMHLSFGMEVKGVAVLGVVLISWEIVGRLEESVEISDAFMSA